MSVCVCGQTKKATRVKSRLPFFGYTYNGYIQFVQMFVTHILNLSNPLCLFVRLPVCLTFGVSLRPFKRTLVSQFKFYLDETCHTCFLLYKQLGMSFFVAIYRIATIETSGLLLLLC